MDVDKDAFSSIRLENIRDCFTTYDLNLSVYSAHLKIGPEMPSTQVFLKLILKLVPY